MVINGKDRNFFLTVGASCAIAEMCPDGDIAKLGELFRGRYAKNMTAIARFIVQMNRGYEERMHPDAEKPDVVTIRELMSLSKEEFHQAEAEAILAFTAGRKTTVDTEEVKSSKKNEDGSGG